MSLDADKIIEQLDSIYGAGKGDKIYLTILPGIIADFRKILMKTAIGETMTEEYRMEDGKASLILKGRRIAMDEYDVNAEVRVI